MAVAAIRARFESDQIRPSSAPGAYSKDVNGHHQPLSPSPSHLPSPSTASSSSTDLANKASLIDLRDWVVEDGYSVPHANGFGGGPTKAVTPLINLEPPTTAKLPSAAAAAPPLPPRKPSLGNLRADKSTPPALPKRPSSTQLRPDKLAIEQHTYPPAKLDLPAAQKNGRGHVPTSSVSSFHSVSLSSDPPTPGSTNLTFPVENGVEVDSLDDSYENVSTTSFGSPSGTSAIADWENARKQAPPRPPPRPSSSSKPPSLHTKSPPPSKPPSIISNPRSGPPSPIAKPTRSSPPPTATNGRRVPPPPPARSSTASDRSSVLSNTTSNSTVPSNPRSSTTTLSLHSNKPSVTSRPTPIPQAARRRYERLFEANVIQRRTADRRQRSGTLPVPNHHEAKKAKAKRKAAGWRGLSVDLITAGEGDESPLDAMDDIVVVDDEVGPSERLAGALVKVVWSRSQLDRSKLRDIWNECDTANEASLDREGFVRGMWRIDEELRRAQLRAPGSAGVRGPAALSGLGALKIKQPVVLPKPKPKPILR